MKPEPMPACTCWPLCVPKKKSNGDAATCWTTSVCTVTTDGATFCTASVMAVRRWSLIVGAGTRRRAHGVCALDGDGEAPSHATQRGDGEREEQRPNAHRERRGLGRRLMSPRKRSRPRSVSGCCSSARSTAGVTMATSAPAAAQAAKLDALDGPAAAMSHSVDAWSNAARSSREQVRARPARPIPACRSRR